MSKVFAGGIALAGLLCATAPSYAQSLADVLHAQRREGNRICLVDHFHSSSGSGPTHQAAERDAASGWSGFTAWEYGNNWGSWNLAASKTMNCSQSGGSWSCSSEARPCKPLAGGGGGTARKRGSKS